MTPPVKLQILHRITGRVLATALKPRKGLPRDRHLVNSAECPCVVELEGNPWFVAADVCRALDMTNPTVAVMPLAADEKAKSFLGFGKPANVISESGLYKLILRAQPDRVPQARQFQDWVTREVLPAIRKDGAYVMGEEKVRTGELISLSLPKDNSGVPSGSGVITTHLPTEQIFLHL